jgi:hypothetical protein
MTDRAPRFGPDYALVWPRELFRSEATALLGYTGPNWNARAELLLAEAFAGDGPMNDLRTASWNDFPALMTGNWNGDAQRAFVSNLVESLDSLPDQAKPRPYWVSRHQSGVPAVKTDPGQREDELKRSWVTVVRELQEQGYLERVAPRGCVDDSVPPPDPSVALSGLSEDALGLPNLWPLQASEWTREVFLSLVEVVHDLVARPRSRSLHDYGGCGWHYSAYSIEAGQALYRWRINRLLNRYDVGLHLAGEGEDTGRLVHVPSDERHQLVQEVLIGTGDDVRQTAEHAIALFRSRSAGVPEKRSAVVALAGLMEERRNLLRDEFLRDDESALFQIANAYGLRHRRADQRTDYDEAFLDWIFWWYLATIELIDRLAKRQGLTTD